MFTVAKTQMRLLRAFAACPLDMVVDEGPDLKLEPLVFQLITDSFVIGYLT